jgi:hypothetical protein
VNFDLGDIPASLQHPSGRFRRFIRTFRFLQALEKLTGLLVAQGGTLPEDDQPSLDLLRAIRVQLLVRINLDRFVAHLGFLI